MLPRPLENVYKLYLEIKLYLPAFLHVKKEQSTCITAMKMSLVCTKRMSMTLNIHSTALHQLPVKSLE